MYRWPCLGTFSVATAVEAVKDVRSERVVARVFCNGIRQGVIPLVGGIPRINLNTHHARSHPIALARAAGQTSSLTPASRRCIGSKIRRDQQETNSRRSAHAVN
jgi:hypothetical protein